MNWRELMKINIPTQYSHNPQKEPQKASFENIENIEHRNENKKALGYGCAGCGCKTYQLVVNGWECENCKAIYEIIGGTRGPQIIN